MLLPVETIMNLQAQVLILALNPWNIPHPLDYFSYIRLQTAPIVEVSMVGVLVARNLALGANIYNRYEDPYNLILSGFSNFVSPPGLEINQGKYCSSYLWYRDLLHLWSVCPETDP